MICIFDIKANIFVCEIKTFGIIRAVQSTMTCEYCAPNNQTRDQTEQGK